MRLSILISEEISINKNKFFLHNILVLIADNKLAYLWFSLIRIARIVTVSRVLMTRIFIRTFLMYRYVVPVF